MNADEVVRALRWIAKDAEFIFAAEQLNGAADLIESLQTEVRAAKDAARVAQDANSEAGNTISQLQAEKWELQDQLAASQRRERAALEDILCTDHCDVCKHNVTNCEESDSDCSVCQSETCTCRTCRNEDKWEWRGPAEQDEA